MLFDHPQPGHLSVDLINTEIHKNTLRQLSAYFVIEIKQSLRHVNSPGCVYMCAERER